MGSPPDRVLAQKARTALGAPELMSSIADQWGPLSGGPCHGRAGLIDGEGVAELSDGTHWQIAYDQLPQTQRWLNGAEISVTLQLRGSMWPYALTHRPTG